MESFYSEIEERAKLIAKLEDEAILNSLIGAKITEFKFEKIQDRKRMYLLTIQTNAKPVALGNNAFACTNEIKLRVHL